MKDIRRARATLLVVLAVVSILRADAQGQSTGAPAKVSEFEVASVRPSGPRQLEANGLYTYPGGRIVGHGCRLQYLIMVAFNVEDFQISGVPAWADLITGDPFEIQAKPPDSSSSAHWSSLSPKIAPGEEERQMLQSLLAGRFQMKFHREITQGPVYLLTRGSGQLKLLPPKDKGEFPWAGGVSGGWFGGGMRGQNISMPQLAMRLSTFLKRPVLDQTGLQGSFDFEYQNGSEDNDADIPSFLMAAMKEIGLSLKSGKGPVETIVIEHAERPSEN